MKKILFLILIVISTSASAQTFNYNGINYNITDDTNFKVEVGSNPTLFGDVIIPGTVTYNSQIYDVTSIGYQAFNYSSLTSVDIPNSVTDIGQQAFYACNNLTSITLPNSVTTIQNGAFERCFNLTAISIPNSVTHIGSGTFADCSALTTISIPNSVTLILSSAFLNCSSLTSVTIPNSVTAIGYQAFRNCSGLTSVTIPNSVSTVEDFAFFDCTNLTTVNCYVQNPLVINANVFGGTTNQVGCTLNVPIGSEAAYEAAAVWTNFNPINGNLLSNDSFVKNSFSIYPNPSNGVFTIALEEDATIFVNDMLGKVVYTNKVNAGESVIDISNYQSGMYLLQVETENGSVTKKLIKE